MRKDDRVRLRHMLDAAKEGIRFAHGRTRDDLDTDRMLTFALIKTIEIIGEAAARVSEAGKEAAPGIPWTDIVAMRNRLTHAYFDVDLDRVWDTIKDDVPPLIAQLENFLRREK